MKDWVVGLLLAWIGSNMLIAISTATMSVWGSLILMALFPHWMILFVGGQHILALVLSVVGLSKIGK